MTDPSPANAQPETPTESPTPPLPERDEWERHMINGIVLQVGGYLIENPTSEATVLQILDFTPNGVITYEPNELRYGCYPVDDLAKDIDPEHPTGESKPRVAYRSPEGDIVVPGHLRDYLPPIPADS